MGKVTSNEACYDSENTCLYWAGSSAACWSRWKGGFYLYHHTYFLQSYVSLKVAVSFPYEASFSIQRSATYSTVDDDYDVTAPSDILL